MQECLSTMCCPWIRDPVQVVSTTSNHRHSLLVDDTKGASQRCWEVWLLKFRPTRGRSIPPNQNNNSLPPARGVQYRSDWPNTWVQDRPNVEPTSTLGVDLTLNVEGEVGSTTTAGCGVLGPGMGHAPMGAEWSETNRSDE